MSHRSLEDHESTVVEGAGGEIYRLPGKLPTKPVGYGLRDSQTARSMMNQTLRDEAGYGKQGASGTPVIG